MLLAGDIGGTKTVLALYNQEHGPREPLFKEQYPSQQYDSLEAVVSAYLHAHNWPISHAAFGVAGPVVEGRAEITNLPWIIERSRLAARFALKDVHLLNDLEAVSTAVPILTEEDVFTLNAGRPDPHGAIARRQHRADVVAAEPFAR